MNNKGFAGVAALLMIAISIIVGSVLLSGGGGIAGQAATLTSTSPIVNETFSLGSGTNNFTDRPNCVNFQGTPILINNSQNTVVLGAGNYSFTTRISPSSGLKVLTVQTLTNEFDGYSVNASYTCVPQGYSEDSVGRVFPPLIVLFTVLGLAIVVIGAAIKNGGFN